MSKLMMTTLLCSLTSFSVMGANQCDVGAVYEASACEGMGYHEYIQCMSESANCSSLAKGDSADYVFNREIKDLKDRYQFDHDVIALNQAFKINLRERPLLSETNDLSARCFEYNPAKENAAEIHASIKEQIDHVALFLAYYHSDSFGTSSSAVFKIGTVDICDRKYTKGHQETGRKMTLVNRKLTIGFDKNDILTANDLMKIWKSGDQLRYFDKGYFNDKIPTMGTLIRKMTFGVNEDSEIAPPLQRNTFRQLLTARALGAEAVKSIIWDKIVDYGWGILDPTSRERKGLTGILFERHAEFFAGLKNNELSSSSINKYLEMKSLTPYLSQQSAQKLSALEGNNEAIDNLYLAWKNEMKDISNFTKLIELSSLQNTIDSQRGAKVLLDLREIESTVSVMNAHDINVVLNLPSKSNVSTLKMNNECYKGIVKDPIEINLEITITEDDKSIKKTGQYMIPYDPCSDLTILASKMSGLVGVNTYDQVGVRITLPDMDNLNPKYYQSALLEELLNNL